MSTSFEPAPGDWPAQGMRLKLLGLGVLAWLPVTASSLMQHLPVPRSPGAFGVGVLCLGAWLAMFIWHSLRGHYLGPGNRRALIVGQALLALAAYALLRNPMVPILLVVFAAQLPGCLSPRAGYVLVGVATVALFAVALSLMTLGDAITLAVAYLAFQFFSLLLSATLLQADRGRAELATINSQLLATQALLKESVRDRERLRITRELHDLVGHKLTALQLNLQAAVRSGEGVGPIATARDIAAQILSDIRNVVAYVPTETGMPLDAALQELARSFPHSLVQVSVSPQARLEDLETAQSILRCVQEATSNAIRHGQASEIRIEATREGDTLVLSVRDDGAGLRGARPGFGLASIRGRVEALGGQVTLSELRPRGTQVRIVVPAAGA